jgi:CRISPR-associated protein Csb1
MEVLPMTDQPTCLDLKTLRAAVEGDAVAFRCVTDLQPAGGTGDKVFPATYQGGEYAFENRVIDGQRVRCVLLDSVQSQANRLEVALLEGYRARMLKFPLVQINFGKADEDEVRAVGVVTALEAPHRLADALFGASEVEEGGKRRPFRHPDPKQASSYGRRFEQASIANATPLFELCPTALVFGMWDSHGPKGAFGERFQRALVSEIVGFDAEPGVRPTSRIDPVIRTAKDIPIEIAGGGWKVVEKGKAKLSEVGLGNVTPSLQDNKTGQLHHGGVTIRSARQTCVLSLPALRRLKFPLEENGKRREDGAVNVAARTTLAALALAAVSWQWRAGFDLRSRCLLVPQQELRIEMLLTRCAQSFSLPSDKAVELLRDAAKDAMEAGLKWDEQPITLYPGRELAKAVQMSRRLAAAEV